MAVIPHIFLRMVTNRTRALSSFATITNSEITDDKFTNGDDYLILATAQTSGDSTATSVQIRLVHGSTAFADSLQSYEPASGSAIRRHTYAIIRLWTAVSGEGIKLEFASLDNSNTINANFVHITAFNMSGSGLTRGTDWDYKEEDADTTLSTSWSSSNNASLTFASPPAGSRWWILAWCQNDNGDNITSLASRIERSGEASDTSRVYMREGEIAADFDTPLLSAVYTCSSSNTFKQQSRNDSASTGDRRFSAIFAINLEKFAQATVHELSPDPTQLSTTEWTEIMSDSIIPSPSSPVLCYGFWIFDVANFARFAGMRMQESGVGDDPAGQTAANYSFGPNWDNTDQDDIHIQTDLASFSTTKTMDIDADINGGTSSNAIKGLVLLLTMELEAAADPPIESWAGEISQPLQEEVEMVSYN